MRVMECIGTVTLSRAHPALRGATWKVVVPLTHAGLLGELSGRGEPLVLYDELSAGIGCQLAVTESAEAAAPFHPDVRPIDAYNAAILDTVSVESLPRNTDPSSDI